jgi:phosphosulfolactate synthase (CoM biosynthesis protein A)
MQLFQQEYDDGIAEKIQASASISYAAALEPCNQELKIKTFKALASVEDSDLYYTQSILVSSSWNKNDDIFDKNEVWAARHSPEHKPTNLEHDEGLIIGHIVSNYPITQDGILIDENTPIENLPEKYHILTGAVIYKSYTKPELQERTRALIEEIEQGTKYVSMECFFKGFDYGLINKNTGEYKVLARDNNTAYLSKYLRAYGGYGEHENYKIGRVLRNITFSGKGYVDKPANPDSIIFSKDEFKFLEKNDDFTKSGVTIFQSTEQMENNTMSEQAENTVADCSEATKAAEVIATELNNEIETMKTAHAETVNNLTSEKDQLVAEKEEAAKKMKDYEDKMKKMEASIIELETKLNQANEAVAAYMKKEKKMVRKAALIDNGYEDDNLDSVLEKFENVDDETFAAMTDMLKNKKKKEEKMAKADEVEQINDITEALENVETTEEIVPAVGGEEVSEVESTRAALVDFVCNRLGKKLNKGE